MSEDKTNQTEKFHGSSSGKIGLSSYTKKQSKMSVTPSPKKDFREDISINVPDFDPSSASLSTTPTPTTFSLSCKMDSKMFAFENEQGMEIDTETKNAGIFFNFNFLMQNYLTTQKNL
jgi:hypothetical protein